MVLQLSNPFFSLMSVQKAIAGRALVIPLSINVEHSQILVRISDAHGRHVQDANVVELSPHNYEIKYTPSEAGQFKLEIMVKGNYSDNRLVLYNIH